MVKKIKKTSASIIALVFAAAGLLSSVPLGIFAELSPGGLPTNKPPATISITEKGDVKVKNIVIFQIAGSTFFARTYWGEAFVRWTVRTNKDTNLVKRFGGKAKLSEIAVGDVLDVEGSLLSGADSLNINATDIRDISLEKEEGSFSGKVVKADSAAGNFVMITDSGLTLTVDVGSNVSIKKGVIFIPLSKVVPGDVVLFVSGSYLQPTQTIEATNVEIYQTPDLFKPRNFQGILKNVSGPDLPATLIVTVGAIDYNVVLDSKAQVFTAKKKLTKLQRFVVGDTVRFYGSIREAEQTTVDAEVVRNLDL
jgi:hypothetical protein